MRTIETILKYAKKDIGYVKGKTIMNQSHDVNKRLTDKFFCIMSDEIGDNSRVEWLKEYIKDCWIFEHNNSVFGNLFSDFAWWYCILTEKDLNKHGCTLKGSINLIEFYHSYPDQATAVAALKNI